MKKLEEIKDELNQKIEEELARQLRAIPQLVEEVVKSSVLSIIGVIKAGNGYSVDRYNKENPLHSYIKRTVDETVQKQVTYLINKELIRLLKTKSLSRSIIDSTMSNATYCFEQETRTQLRNSFSELAKRYAKKIEKYLEEAMADVSQINLDILDPNSYEGLLGELLLEEQARLIAETELDETDDSEYNPL